MYIKVPKLFKGGNYSSAETIRGNTILGKKLNLRQLFEVSTISKCKKEYFPWKLFAEIQYLNLDYDFGCK